MIIMFHRRLRIFFPNILLCIFLLFGGLIGCSQTTDTKTTESKKNNEEVKRMPDKKTEVTLGLPSRRNTSYLPIYIALKKGYFQKYNLNVKLTYVQGGVLALRGLQTGDFHLISSLPESVITSVSEGASVKLIGTLDNQSMYSIYVSKDIKNLDDLKGKNAAGMVPGNGTSIQLEYWLRKQGLEPNKDVRIIYAGDNTERLQTVQQKQAAVTILSPPTDLKAEKLGLKRYLMRDVLKTYNHNMIVTSDVMIREKPQVIYAFMSALSDAIAFTKDEKNRDEAIKVMIDEFEMSKADAEKSVDFVIPALADKGKINIEGLKWAMDTVKKANITKKNVTLDKMLDERFYAK